MNLKKLKRVVRSFIVGATSCILLVSFGAAPAFADTAAPVLPSNSELYGVGYYVAPKVGLINTTDSTVSLLTENVGEAANAEGGGFDLFTGRTWIMQDCEIFTLNPDGSTNLQFSLSEAFNDPDNSCWGFTTVGDGTAYISGRHNPDRDKPEESSTVMKISLLSGEVIGTPQLIDVVGNSFGDTEREPYMLEPTDLAYNPLTGDLWTSTYSGYIYHLDPTTGDISNIYDGFIAQEEWSWGMAVDSNNVLWLMVGNVTTWDQFVTLSPDNSWERHDFPGLTIPGTSTTFDSDAMWIKDTTPPAGTGHVINITVNCDEPINITADIGDTLVFTLKHDGCNGSYNSGDPAGNYANLNNLNGTYFSDETFDVDNDVSTPDVTPYQGSATGSGFLTYVGHTQNTEMAYDYWGKLANGSQDDWYIVQTEAGGQDVVITTILRATDGNGTPLVSGSAIASIFTESVDYAPEEFLVRYAGPRTVTTLAKTGVDSAGYVGSVALLLILGTTLMAIRMMSRKKTQKS